MYPVYEGARPVDQHIDLAETTDLAAADFTRQGSSPAFGLGVGDGGSGSLESDGGKPSKAVPPGWLTAGAKAGGDELAAVVRLTVTGVDEETIQGIQLVYGEIRNRLASPGATTVEELPRPDDPERWARIPADTLEIQEGRMSGLDGEHLDRTGSLVESDRYVTITTPRGEAALVEIARSLRPVR